MSVCPLESPSGPRGAGVQHRFTCTHERGTCASWVHLAGELDIATAPRLSRALAEAQAGALLVVLDPSRLSFIDCAGLHVITDAAARARSGSGWLLLVGSSPVLERLLALTGTQDLVTVFDLDLDLDRTGPGPDRGETGPDRGETGSPELGRRGRLRAVRDNAEAAPLPSGVLDQAWP